MTLETCFRVLLVITVITAVARVALDDFAARSRGGETVTPAQLKRAARLRLARTTLNVLMLASLLAGSCLFGVWLMQGGL